MSTLESGTFHIVRPGGAVRRVGSRSAIPTPPVSQLATALRHEPCSLAVSAGITFFLDGAGGEWKVFDCFHVTGRLVILGTGSMAAEERVFEPLAGPKRVYRFQLGEPRNLQVAHAQRQFAASTLLTD